MLVLSGFLHESNLFRTFCVLPETPAAIFGSHLGMSTCTGGQEVVKTGSYVTNYKVRKRIPKWVGTVGYKKV